MPTQRIAVRIPRNQTDPDAQAFITAAGITDTTQKSAINTLVTNLKAYGIWTKMKALYPMVGGTAASHKFNLKDPRDLDAAFRLVFNGGWTHSANGALPNGTNAFASTVFNPTTQALSTSSQHLSYYSRTNVSEPAVEIGVIETANNNFLALYNSGTSGTRSSLASSARYNQAMSPVDTRGLFVATRVDASNLSVYRNGSLQATQTISSTGNDNYSIFLGAYGANTPALYSSKQCAFASIGDGLTDTEAANFYTAVQAFQTTLGRSIGTQTVSDADAQAFINAAQITDQVQATAINNLVVGLKADSIWTKMKALYPFVGGTAASHKFNLKDPRDLDAAFRLVFSGGWTHSANGALPNGTNAYANTFLAPSTNLSLNSTHISGYIRTNSVSHAPILSSENAGSYDNGLYIWPLQNQGYYSVRVNDNTSNFATVTYDIRGLHLATRTGANVKKYRVNTTQIFNSTTASSALNTSSIYIGASRNNANYYSNQIAFNSIGDGLTDTEAANFYTRVQAFQTTLGRQV